MHLVKTLLGLRAHGGAKSAGHAKSQLCRYQNRNREWKVGFKKGRESLMHLGMMVLGIRQGMMLQMKWAMASHVERRESEDMSRLS